MFLVWGPWRSSSTRISIWGSQILVSWSLTSAMPSSKVIALNFPWTKRQSTLPPPSRQYANCSNDHRFLDSQQMYTYRLAAEAWHRLLQLERSSVRNLPTDISSVQISMGVDRPNSHCPSQSQCMSLLASLVCSVTQTIPQPALPPLPPKDQTHKVHSLRALR